VRGVFVSISADRSSLRFALSAFCGVALALAGCSRQIPVDSLVLTQSPRALNSESAGDSLDVRYPSGSRVVLAIPSHDSTKIRVLSQGLFAAGEPVMSYDGRRVVFAGKRAAKDDWQIYETRLQGGSIRVLTEVVGGAMDPALLPDGSLLYIAPVLKTTADSAATNRSALYVQSPGGQPRQLTFSGAGISSPTVLSDGRILFVSSQPHAVGSRTGLALYTINNDGTEVAAFAGQHDEPLVIQRPRQLEDGRIVFIVTDSGNAQLSKAEYVLSAHPFGSRESLFPNSSARVRSVEPSRNGDLLVCAEPESGQNNCCRSCAVFRLSSAAKALGSPVLVDPDWDTTESIPATSSPRPMGRLSNVDLSRKTGQILCLDANDTTYGLGTKATRIRVFTRKVPGTRAYLGEVELQADGSFMAEVPADIPLGFEALEEGGHVLRHVEPIVWVRPGENRSCIGCHERHNHSPRNFRPLAVRVPVPQLLGEPDKLAQKSP
jgi:hypothetical protein